jgi:puromycin-sensitive aminopeptidase
MTTKAYRLPTHARPQQYEVHLDARLGREEVTGRVAIRLDLLEARDTLELHARDLTISGARLEADGQALTAQVALDPESEAARLKFPQPLPVGAATLTLAFQGRVGQNLRGLYLAQDGPEQLLCTQCEATDARAIFPCWDEPSFKARFAFQVTTAPSAVVLANSPLVSVVENGDARTWTFAPTKVMSSYLAALVIGEVAGTQTEAINGTPLRVWALRGKEHMGAFALQYTKRLLPWYEAYFGAPYHFDKYDQVAVPGFAAGAMENSGLVLFRQNLLLMDPKTASWRQEKAIAHVIAHEFAHMWFGNLVTLQWWDDLWLNEAFAEWIAHKVVDELSPDYAIWDDFQSGKNGALATDALESTHPIYSPVATPAEATELFDAITYTKGCAVLRMLENFVGADNFRAGLRAYMREFAERNAQSADLWRRLQAASNAPVTQIMESWILQSGYPSVTLALDDGNRLRMRQQRFFSNPKAPADNAQLWRVPLVVRYEDEAGVHTARHLLAEREAVLPLEVAGTLRWCYANADEIGFYRQRLTGKLLENVLTNLGRLSTSERMGLLNDQWALTRSGAQKITDFLDVLTALAGVDDYHVVEAAVSHLHNVEKLLEETGDARAVQNFRAWVGRLFAGRQADLGFVPRKDEPLNKAQQRIFTVDAMACLAHNAQAIAQARHWAEREAVDPTAVDANLAGVFLAAAAQFGSAAQFEQYVSIYQKRKASGAAPQETNRYLANFHHFRAPDLVERTLGLMDERLIPQEGIGPVLARMLAERHAQLMAWAYIKSNWKLINDLGPMWAGNLIEAAGQLPAPLRADFVAFCEANAKETAPMSYARALERMDLLAEFKTRTRDDLIAWFQRPA